MKIGFMGDVMLGRYVDTVINEKGYAYPFGNLLSFLLENDLNIINLETTLTRSRQKVSKVFNFKASPDKVECLRLANIALANIANNHILDYDIAGLQETLRVLQKAGIQTVGAGDNLEKASTPIIYRHREGTLGLYGCTDNEPDWGATPKKPGTNYLRVGDIKPIETFVKFWRDKADLLIVSIHWGPNNREVPTPSFQSFAHDIIDLGVDVIHGHSAHLVQGIEVYKNKLILYDTGDFVDDYQVGPDVRNDYTFLFILEISNHKLKCLRLIPAKIDWCQVNKAEALDRRIICQRIKKLSQPWGTMFEEKNNELVLNF